ncbi:cell wall / vacuolar inhibitor of fructosidase 1-like [Malus domestica]|uniref:cell wall / vacuolar inhibitor of fructosidase 1-like n=1 Tax=Malus domestica TaxID=3750 RepID=UPI003976E2CA
MDANIIDQICKKTPDYNLCVSSLNSDPRSAIADVAVLGLVMVDIAKTKATDVAKKINELLKQSPSDPCTHFYKTILEADIPEAAKAFIGNPKFAEQGMNNAAGEAQTCEDGFSGKSPLINENKAAMMFVK